jgi:type IV secretory pathway VirB2 component (pilin)
MNACYSAPVHDSKDTALRLDQGLNMGRPVAIVLYIVAMAAVIVGVDVMFFRNRFWERLTVNIGIVLVFAAFYFRFLRRL